MKLTKNNREAFVLAAMRDVPTEDYKELIRGAVTKAAIAAMPPAVAKLYKDHATKDWIRSESISVSRRFGEDEHGRPNNRMNRVSVYVPYSSNGYSAMQELADAVAGPIFDAWEQDDEKRAALSLRLRRVAWAANTRQQLLDALPDFAKYVPEPQPVYTPNLPALATSIADDFKKAGWKKAA